MRALARRNADEDVRSLVRAFYPQSATADDWGALIERARRHGMRVLATTHAGVKLVVWSASDSHFGETAIFVGEIGSTWREWIGTSVIARVELVPPRRNPDEERRRGERGARGGGALESVRAAVAAERLDGAAAAFEADLVERVVSQGYGTLVSIAGSLWMLLFSTHTIGTAVAHAFVYVYEGQPHGRFWRRATLTQPLAPDHVSELLTVLGPQEPIRAGVRSWQGELPASIPGDTVWVYQHTSERAHWLEDNFRIYDGLVSGVVPTGVPVSREVAMRWVTIFRAQGPLVRGNPGDEDLRDLERRAAEGDPAARRRLIVEKRRRGLLVPRSRGAPGPSRTVMPGILAWQDVFSVTVPYTTPPTVPARSFQAREFRYPRRGRGAGRWRNFAFPVGPYLVYNAPDGAHRSAAVSATDAAMAAIQSSIAVTPDRDSLYFETHERDDGTVDVYYKHNVIIGSRLLATVDLLTVPFDVFG